MADDMDIDAVMAELEPPPSSSSPAKTTSFKPSRFRPKPRGAATSADATAKSTNKTTIKPKIEPKDPIPKPAIPKTEPKDPIPNPAIPTSSQNTNPKPDPDASWSIGSDVVEMEADAEEEDEVVREIDVFMSPSPLDEDETKIYLMQYPLRPNWQSYELETRCTEVRMMPKCKKMEIDFRIDDDDQTYDADMARPLGIDKQTLRSLVVPSATDYAVGILRNNQIHLTLIDGVVQLRPVIRSHLQKRKHTTQETDTEKNVPDSSPSSSKTKIEPVDSAQTEEEVESWVPLEFLPENSIPSDEYHQKMVTTVNTKIEFRMTQADYMGALCPGVSSNQRETKEAIIRELLKLPLEERLRKWFTEVSQLNRFDFIEYMLARGEPEKEVLRQVQKLADLVHGVWVTKTSLLYEGLEATAVRDYVLLQFTKCDSIPCKKLRNDLRQDVLSIKNELVISLLRHLIISKPKEDKVKFKGMPDPTFRKRYASVVREQEQAWSAREESILEMAKKYNMTSVSGTRRVGVLKEDKEKKVTENGAGHGDGGPAIPANKSISMPETRKHLLEALAKIFDEQKVRTINSVVRDLRELAKRLSALPKDSDRNKHLIDGALCGASASQTNLQKVVNQVAVHVYGVYVMKPSKKDHLSIGIGLVAYGLLPYLMQIPDKKRPMTGLYHSGIELDDMVPKSEVEIIGVNKFMLAEKPKAVLRKQEIMQRGKEILKREINESEYAQVVDEICITTEDGGVMLRTGD